MCKSCYMFVFYSVPLEAEENLKSKRNRFKLLWDRGGRTWQNIWTNQLCIFHGCISSYVSFVLFKSHMYFIIRQLRTLLTFFFVGNRFANSGEIKKIQIWLCVCWWGVMYWANNKQSESLLAVSYQNPQKGLRDSMPCPFLLAHAYSQ